MPPAIASARTDRESSRSKARESSRDCERLERLRFAIDQHAIVAITDAAGRITYANEKFCELTGYSRDELIGQDHRLINSGYHPPSFFRDMWRTVREGRVWKGTICNKAKDGHHYWVTSTIVPFADESGSIVEYIAIRTDITEHRETAQRLAEMKETAHGFVDHVSHEFRTPLTVIKEFASIIRDELVGAVNDEQREYLGIVVSRVDDLAALVDDMLDSSKLDAGLLGINREDCRIEDVVERVRSTLERRAEAVGAALDFDVPAGLPAIHCDKEKAGRVITNLVINALKYGGQPAAVQLRVRANAADNELAVSIVDNGPGIAPEDLALLFKRFCQLGGQYQQGFKGFGLGLCIAKQLAHLNLGDVTVASERGAGSTFTFTLPFSHRRSLLDRYLRRIIDIFGQQTRVTLSEISAPEDAPADQLDELSYILRSHAEKWDLLLRQSPHRWLLVAAANHEPALPMEDRVRSACADAARGQPEDTLPALRWKRVGSWQAQSESAAVIDCFLALTGDMETVGA